MKSTCILYNLVERVHCITFIQMTDDNTVNVKKKSNVPAAAVGITLDPDEGPIKALGGVMALPTRKY